MPFYLDSMDMIEKILRRNNEIKIEDVIRSLRQYASVYPVDLNTAQNTVRGAQELNALVPIKQFSTHVDGTAYRSEWFTNYARYMLHRNGERIGYVVEPLNCF